MTTGCASPVRPDFAKKSAKKSNPNQPERTMRITNRQIARAARKIWKYEASDGRDTIRAVLTALKIKHEKPRR